MRSLVICFLLVTFFFAGSIAADDLSVRAPHSRVLPLLWQSTTPGFSTTPAPPIDLGPSAVGVTTPQGFAVPLQINNPGTAPLTISAISFSPDFTMSAETLFVVPTTINPGASSNQIPLLFKPQGTGLRTGQFTTTDNASGSPHSVQLTGTGVDVPANDFGIVLDPGTASPVNVTAGSTTAFPVWLLAGPNLGNTSLTVQCSAGSNACNLDSTSEVLVGDSTGTTRAKIMVSLSVPSRSALLLKRPSALFWGFPACASLALLGCRKRGRHVRIGLAVLSMAFLLVSCGGGGSSANNTVVITAVPTQGTAHSVSVPLSVH